MVVFSCSNDDDPKNLKISGTFYYDFPNCDNSSNPEENCSEFVWFTNNETTAVIMTGGSDFGLPVNYELIDNTEIHFYYSTGNKAEVSFRIINNETLERLENNNIWNKKEE